MDIKSNWPGSRLAIERMYKIHQLLKEGACPTARELAERFEVSTRTIQRDMEFIRDRIIGEIEFNRSTKTYSYTNGVELPSMRLTEGEMVVFYLGEKLLKQCAGTPYETEIKSAMEKISGLLHKDVQCDLDSLQKSVSFKPPSLTKDTKNVANHYTTILTAIKKRKVIKLDYWGQIKAEQSIRLVEPYHLLHSDGMWYLIAFCRLRETYRTFALERILSLEVLGECYTARRFDLDSYLSHSWGVERGRKHQVCLRFSAKQAPWIRERIWHPKQQLEEQEDGSLLFKVHVEGLGEITRWVMQYGAEVEVLSPEELRQAVTREISRLAELYRPAIS